jgi:outer membrane protein OmpU
MKKLLLASTALVASAGVAAADMSVSGNGRLGVLDSLGLELQNPDELGFTSRIRVIFTGSGETDGGLSFGGTVRADNASGGNSGTAGNVFISGDFGTLTMGDVSGAPEAAVGDVSGVGLTGLGDINEAIYLSNANRPAMRYDYSFGDFGVHISADNPAGDNETYGVAVSGAFAGFSFGLGYESVDYTEDTDLEIWGGDADDGTGVFLTLPGGTDAEHIIGGLTGTFAGFTGQAIYGQADINLPAGSVELEQWQVSVDYTFDLTTVTAYYASLDFSDAVDVDGESWGIGAAYDLGGGASVRAGYVDANIGDFEDDAFDFGVSFTF